MTREIRITCPKCNAILEPFEASGVEVDVCPTCAGVWLDKGELEKLYGSWGIVDIERATAGDRAVPPSTPAVDLSCPACEGKLITISIKGVGLDGCIKCGGLWLDKGEIGPALDHVGQQGDPELIQRLAAAVAARRGEQSE